VKIPDVKWIIYKKVIHRRYRYEPKVMGRLKRIHGDLFVDIGAYVGKYTLALRKNFREIIAFEPNSLYLPIIKKATKDYNNILIEEMAVANFDGTATLFPQNDDPANVNTILEEFEVDLAGNPEAKRVFRGTNGVQVKCISFDTYFRERSIDVVKVDVEGAEFLVLEGMNNAMDEGRIKNIVIELHDVKNKNKLLDLLTKHFSEIVWLGLDHCFARAPKLARC
jgi:FkbM family methyltransferase